MFADGVKQWPIGLAIADGTFRVQLRKTIGWCRRCLFVWTITIVSKGYGPGQCIHSLWQTMAQVLGVGDGDGFRAE